MKIVCKFLWDDWFWQLIKIASYINYRLAIRSGFKLADLS